MNVKASNFVNNGSPGQTTLLDRFGSKFCIEPWSQSQSFSQMSPNPIERNGSWPECPPEFPGDASRNHLVRPLTHSTQA